MDERAGVRPSVDYSGRLSCSQSPGFNYGKLLARLTAVVDLQLNAHRRSAAPQSSDPPVVALARCRTSSWLRDGGVVQLLAGGEFD